MRAKGAGNATDSDYTPSYDKSALLPVKNSDNYCLFYALELARKFHDQKEIERFKKDEPIPMQRKELIGIDAFRNFRSNRSAQYANVIRLIGEAGIPPDRQSYGVEDAKKVQEYYNKKYPETYRIVIMGDNPEIKPIWSAPLLSYRYQVAIFHDGTHYEGLKSVGKYFFGPRVKYCIGKLKLQIQT